MIELLHKKTRILLWISLCGPWFYQSVSATAFRAASSGDANVFWQTRTVTGTITSTDGTPLPGATVVIKGSANGTTTDADGKFNISVPDNSAILLVSFIGYLTQEIEIGNQTTIDIV